MLLVYRVPGSIQVNVNVSSIIRVVSQVYKRKVLESRRSRDAFSVQGAQIRSIKVNKYKCIE